MRVKNSISKKLVLLVFFLGVPFLGLAQQDPQYTQYMYNTTNINPAYTGSKGHLSFFGLYRAQWVGLDGAPKTFNFAADSPLGDSKLSLGVNFVNDKIGATTENTFAINLAYTVNLTYDLKLAFGLKGTGNLFNVDYTKLDIEDPNDPLMQTNIKNKFNPNIGAGLFLYSDRGYVGFSIPHLLETNVGEIDGMKILRQKAHYYLMAGYVFDVSQSVKLKPAALAKAVDGAPVQVDITANAMFMERLTLGVAYRVNASVSALAGFQVSDNIFIGYTYDADTSKLKNYNNGSHEIFLRFDLFNRYNKVSSSRFF
ncbi:PorP/SprF family type IX secretion system membrane protein [Myroides sp. LJL119]